MDLGSQLKWSDKFLHRNLSAHFWTLPPVPSFGENQEEGLFEKEEEFRK
jgi:hypothetical protein